MRTKTVYPEERIQVPLAVWKAQVIEGLSCKLRRGEKVLLVPEKSYAKLQKKPQAGRIVGEYRVRRDGHSQHYYAVVVPKGFNPAAGRHGGWVPDAGPKVKVIAPKSKTLTFKPTLFLENRAKRVSEVATELKKQTRNTRIAKLVLLGVSILEGGASWNEQPSVDDAINRTTKAASLRVQPDSWDRLIAKHQRPNEDRTEFLRRLLWIGIQAAERKYAIGNNN